MTTTTLLIFASAAIVLIALGIFFTRTQRIRRFRSRYGSEYDSVVEETGSRHKAMAQLREREKRVRSFELKPLSADDAARFDAAWTAIQAKFVEDPLQADADADALLQDILEARGYPKADFKQRTADLSVDYGETVRHYRAAHDLATGQHDGEAGTEDLRQAMLRFRELYGELMQTVANDTAASPPLIGKAAG